MLHTLTCFAGYGATHSSMGRRLRIISTSFLCTLTRLYENALTDRYTFPGRTTRFPYTQNTRSHLISIQLWYMRTIGFTDIHVHILLMYRITRILRCPVLRSILTCFCFDSGLPFSQHPHWKGGHCTQDNVTRLTRVPTALYVLNLLQHIYCKHNIPV